MVKFAVVEFLAEHSVEFVPPNWIQGDKCWWPNARKLTSAHLALKEDW